MTQEQILAILERRATQQLIEDLVHSPRRRATDIPALGNGCGSSTPWSHQTGEQYDLDALILQPAIGPLEIVS